jgi:orotate phosphoribosyltransferase
MVRAWLSAEEGSTVRDEYATGEVHAQIAHSLVQRGAVTFRADPFYTFTSGVESPIYIDNRRMLGYVSERIGIVNALSIRAEKLGRFDAVAGTATAGIPWAAWLADSLGLPLLYVRAQAKKWGHERSIEGVARPGDQILLVEDLVFSAGSLATATVNLRENGLTVDHWLAIVTYDTSEALTRAEDMGVKLANLTTVDSALVAAEALGNIDAESASVVADWLQRRR